MKILISDDETPKLGNLKSFIGSQFPDATISSSRSVRSTIAAVAEHSPHIVVLDMSLPTFDIAPGEPGGRPQNFGGIEVLRHLKFQKLTPKIIVVTQYGAFPQGGDYIDLPKLSAKMKSDYPNSFEGCIFYGALNDSWKPELASLIRKLAGEIAP